MLSCTKCLAPAENPAAKFCAYCGTELVLIEMAAPVLPPLDPAQDSIHDPVQAPDAAPAAPPASFSQPGQARLDKLMAGGFNLSLGRAFSRGWEIFYQYPLAMIGFGVIIYLIGAISGPLLVLPLWAGYSVVALMIARRQPREFGDFFKGFNHFIPLFVAGLLICLFLILGLFTCGILTVYLSVAYILVIPLILFFGLGFSAALTTSRMIIHKNWFEMFFFMLLLGVINVLGALTLLGWLFTLPYTACVIAAAEQEILGLES